MRIPLATTYKNRTGDPDKDARIKNAYIETKQNQNQVVRKRPAAQFGRPVGSGIAQGGIQINSAISGVSSYAVVFNGDVPHTVYPNNFGPNSFATFNPLDKSSFVTLSGGNLIATLNAADTNFGSVRATRGFSAGKWYWELTINNMPSSIPFIGFCNLSASINKYIGYTNDGWADASDNAVFITGQLTNGPGGLNPIFYGNTFTTGDIIGIAVDMDAALVTFYKNGVSQGLITTWPNIAPNGTVYPAISVGNTIGNQITANFGASPFVYSVPTGFNAGVY